MSKFKHLMEGRPVKAPLHAAIVHFPLAFFLIGTVLDVASWLAPRSGLLFVPAAFWALAAGVALALVAALFGFVDYTSIREDHPGKRYATLHMVLNLAAVALYTLALGLRYPDLGLERTPVLPLALSVGGLLLLAVSGYVGGHLVYNDGIGVGRHRRDTDMPGATRRPEAEDDGFAPICHVDEFVEGSTLRANIRGTVMTIVKSNGEFYAVQEFCTHRFAPMSQGAVIDGRIMCPWHRSCFDMKTGAVTDGPAKVPLKTFPLEIRGGRIFVKAPAETESAAK